MVNRAESMSHLEEDNGYRAPKEIGEVAREFLGVGAEVLEGPELDRKYEITVERDGNLVQLLLKSDKGTINLTDYLPEGYRFVEGDEYFCQPDTKVIMFPSAEVGTRRFLFTLFHEIGHSRTSIEHEFTTLEKLKANISKLLNLHKALFTKKGEVIKDPQFAGFVSPEILFPRWYLEAKGETEAQNERNAWAYALANLRQLKQQGIDAFSGFENLEELQDFINFHLFTYELCHIGKLTLAQLLAKGTEFDAAGYQMKSIRPVDLAKGQRRRQVDEMDEGSREAA
jgi:hypothetical protein